MGGRTFVEASAALAEAADPTGADGRAARP